MVTLTTAQHVRLRIQDIPTRIDATYAGDGTAASYALPHRNVTSGSAFVPVGNTAWSATGATFDASGFVSFSGSISANSPFRTVYVHSTFSDEEIDQFLSVGGSVNGASQEAVMALMFDGLKRARWAAPDGSSYDDTAALRTLKDLYDTLRMELEDEAISGGGVESWALEQGNY